MICFCLLSESGVKFSHVPLLNLIFYNKTWGAADSNQVFSLDGKKGGLCLVGSRCSPLPDAWRRLFGLNPYFFYWVRIWDALRAVENFLKGRRDVAPQDRMLGPVWTWRARSRTSSENKPAFKEPGVLFILFNSSGLRLVSIISGKANFFV